MPQYVNCLFHAHQDNFILTNSKSRGVAVSKMLFG